MGFSCCVVLFFFSSSLMLAQSFQACKIIDFCFSFLINILSLIVSFADIALFQDDTLLSCRRQMLTSSRVIPLKVEIVHYCSDRNRYTNTIVNSFTIDHDKKLGSLSL